MSDSTIGTDEIAAHLKSLVDNWDELKNLSDARADRWVLWLCYAWFSVYVVQ